MTLILAFLAALLVAGPKSSVNTQSDNLALRGYDAVAYFTDGAAVRGLPQFETAWNGARRRFATAAHQTGSSRHLRRYAPQFGGHCAWAVANGYTADGDPEAWKIVSGMLYVNYSKRVQRKWEPNIPE